MSRFQRVCACIVARRGYNAGQTVREIADLAGKSPATIRRWLHATGRI